MPVFRSRDRGDDTQHHELDGHERLDFIEIVFVVVPIVGPALLMLDISPVWFAIMIAVNL